MSDKVYEEKKNTRSRIKKEKDKVEYDILHIDLEIKNCFDREKEKLQEYKNRLESMIKLIITSEVPYGIDQSIINNLQTISNKYDINIHNEITEEPVVFSFREYIDFYNNIQKNITKIYNIETNALQQKYFDMTKDIISEFKLLLEKPIKKSFLSKGGKNEDNSYKLFKLTELYIKIAKNFIDIDSNLISNTKNIKTSINNDIIIFLRVFMYILYFIFIHKTDLLLP